MKKTLRLIFGLLGLALLLAAAWQVRAPAGLEVVTSRAGNIPVRFVAPQGGMDGSRPLLLIGHGFAGSEEIMRGFAYTLAKAGYVTASWDFDGHAQNSNPLPADVFSGNLVANAEQVLAEAQRLGIGDTARLAILGHSMGSGVALQFGQDHPETMATIAVSPVGTKVKQALPRNLLLLAGSREPNFVENARARLEEAGGEGGDPTLGTARKLVVIPGVEHVTIVLAPATHQAARGWLDGVFGAQPGAVDYTDRRIFWYALGLVGAILAALFLVPASDLSGAGLPLGRRSLALIGGAAGATLLLSILDWLGIDLTSSLRLVVGGYLLIWFAISGIIALILLNGIKGWSWLRQTSGKALISGLLVGALLWLGVGLLGGQVWLPWLLIPARLILWPLAAGCVLPWFLAVGKAASQANIWGRFGWWFFSTALVIGSLLLAMQVTPGLFFLLLILPIFPLILGAHALAAGRQRDAWAFALGAALFCGWALLAVFPLAG